MFETVRGRQLLRSLTDVQGVADGWSVLELDTCFLGTLKYCEASGKCSQASCGDLSLI